MIIDSKGKLFGKISIIDILVVAVILAGIAGVGYKFAKSGQVTPFTKQDTVLIEFYHYEQLDFNAETMKEGTPVKDGKTNSYIGKVKKVEVSPSKSTAPDDKGEYKESAKPGWASVKITVEGTGIYRDGINGQGVSLDGTDYFVGRSVEVCAGNNAMWTYIRTMSKKE